MTNCRDPTGTDLTHSQKNLLDNLDFFSVKFFDTAYWGFSIRVALQEHDMSNSGECIFNVIFI